MAAKVSFKSMDYFKFRKYIIDKDDPSSCSKDVTSLCTCVHTLNMRDDKFDEGAEENARLEEIFNSYKQILSFKRVEAVDVRLKSGWWGDQKSGLSVGKVKPTMLKEMLVNKCKDWNERHGDSTDVARAIEGAGVYVFKHKEKSCFQQVFTCSDNIFARCAELFKNTFDAVTYSPLGSLLLVSLVNDWDFYFIPSEATTELGELLNVLLNDTILKHDTLWPHGLNTTLSIETPFDINQFRESCVRHNWPPERVCRPSKIQSIDPGKLKLDQKRLKSQPPSLRSPVKNNTSPTTSSSRPNSARPSSIGNSIAVSSICSPKSPRSPLSARPSTAHARQQRSEEKAPNEFARKEVSDTRRQSKSIQKQETNSLRDKKNSRSFQNFKKEISNNDIQTLSKNESKPQYESSHKLNGSAESQLLIKETREREDDKNSFKQQSITYAKSEASMKNRTESDGQNDKTLNGVQEKVKDDERVDDDEFFKIKPLKRSGTFTLSDSEEDKQEQSTNESTLTSRAVLAARQLTSKS